MAASPSSPRSHGSRGTRRAQAGSRPGDATEPAAARPAKRRRTSGGGTRPGLKAEVDPARRLLQRLLALTPDAVLTVQGGGGLGRWSAGASRLTGRRRRDVQRHGVAQLFREPKDYEQLLEDLESRGRVTDEEFVLVRSNGEEVPVRVYATRLKGMPPRAPGTRSRRHKRAKGRAKAAQPDVDRYLIVLHDMTEVQHIRHRLIENEKLSAMAKIAGSVAHEFRNPLNSLFLSTDLLEDELQGSEEIHESIAPTLLAIREEIERLNQIITHYLSLSKIASREPEQLDLAGVVDAFAGEWQERAAEREVELLVRADDAEHPLSADPNQVRRILVNLVENAFDALEAADAGRPRTGRVTLMVRRMRRSVKLTVKDNGPGIPTDVRDRVFEPFFTSKSGGSGLGLYLVREIVLAAGGSLSLSSTEGRGTSVSVRWPLAAD